MLLALAVAYEWNFRVLLPYREALIRGVIVSLELTAITIIVGTLLGVLLALGRLSKNFLARSTCIALVETIRSIPLLVLLVWIYYCLPILVDFRFSGFASAAIGLSVNLGAFAAETIRAGIEAIPSGYVEAARSLGMTSSQTMKKVVLPQAIRQMMPSLVSLYISMFKLSSLAAVIAVTELLHAANNIISVTFRPLEVYTVIAIIYMVFTLPGVLLSKKLETGALLKGRSIKLDERQS